MASMTTMTFQKAGMAHGSSRKYLLVATWRAGSAPAASSVISHLSTRATSLMADSIPVPTLLVGTYEKVLFGFALHLKAAAGAARFTPLFSAPGHIEPIKSVAANSKFVATGGQDETINVYNLRRKTELGALRQQDGAITALAFSGQYLISGASDGSLVIWKSGDWNVASILRGHKSGILALSVHPSGKACISIASDKKLRLWNLLTSKSAFTLMLPGLCEEVFWSPAADRFALMSRTAIYVYNSSGKPEIEIPQKKPALCMSWISDKEIAVGSEDFGVHLWDLETSTERVHLKGHESRIRVIRTFVVDKKTFLVSGATDGTVLVWDTAASVAEPLIRIETNLRITCLTVTMATHDTSAPAAGSKRKEEKLKVEVKDQKKKKSRMEPITVEEEVEEGEEQEQEGNEDGGEALEAGSEEGDEKLEEQDLEEDSEGEVGSDDE